MSQETQSESPARETQRTRRRTIVRRGAAVFAVVMGLWVLAAVSVWMAAPASPGAGEKYEVIIVLGAGCVGDKPSVELEGRVRKGVELFKQGRAPVLMLTGRGTDRVAEAVCARGLALELGVPREAILMEEKSMDTRGNAVEARKLTDARRVLLVSSDFHGFRAVRIFRPLFDEVAFEGARGTVFRTVWGSMREPAGVVKMWCTGDGGNSPAAKSGE